MAYNNPRTFHDGAIIPDGCQPITPGTQLREPCIGIYVGGSGDLVVDMVDSTGTPLKAVPAGTLLTGRFINVQAAGTTATNLVAFYASFVN